MLGPPKTREVTLIRSRMFVASFDRACYRYQSLNATHYPLRPPLQLPLCRLPARVLKGQFRAHEACFMCRPTYIIHAYRIRQSLSRLTHRRLLTPKPLTTAVQWWALLQPTDAVRLTPSLAKDVCSVKGVTTKFVFHVRSLRIVPGFNPFHSIGLPWEHTHPISSVTRPFQYVPAARDRISSAV